MTVYENLKEGWKEDKKTWDWGACGDDLTDRDVAFVYQVC